MQCLKCGRETAEGQVFCAHCTDTMEKYPVKPGTLVAIPTRPQRIVRTAPPRLEDQILRLRIRLRRARICAAALLLALAASVSAGVYLWFHQDEGFSIGQNYHTVDVDSTVNQGGR